MTPAAYSQPPPTFPDTTNFASTVFIRQIQPIHIFIRLFTQIKITMTTKL